MKSFRGVDLLSKIRSKKIPFIAQMEITNRCNLNCIHCIRDTNIKNELTTEEAKNILFQLSKMGCLIIIFTGGEPLCRKDFFEIAGFASRHGFGVKIFTNGTLINRRNIMKLKKIKVSETQVSLYGVTPEVHERVTQVKGSFTKTIEAIKLLKEYNLTFIIATMIMNSNFKDVPKIKEMCRENGWNFLPDFILRPTYQSSFKPLKYRLNDQELNQARRLGLLPSLGNDNGKSKLNKEWLCFHNIGHLYICITADGKMMPFIGTRVIIGDLRKEPMHYIWNKSKKLNWFKELKLENFECSKCKHCFTCHWDPSLSLSEHNNFFAVPKEICRITKARIKTG